MAVTSLPSRPCQKLEKPLFAKLSLPRTFLNLFVLCLLSQDLLAVGYPRSCTFDDQTLSISNFSFVFFLYCFSIVSYFCSFSFYIISFILYLITIREFLHFLNILLPLQCFERAYLLVVCYLVFLFSSVQRPGAVER